MPGYLDSIGYKNQWRIVLECVNFALAKMAGRLTSDTDLENMVTYII